MSKALLMLCAVLVLMPIGAAAQDDQATKPKPGQDPTAQLAIPPPKGPPAPSDRFVRTLTNVQVELTLTDQVGTQRAGEENRVDDRLERQLGQDSLGRQRAAAGRRAVRGRLECRCPSVRVGRGPDPARADDRTTTRPRRKPSKDTVKPRPTGINQSLTVVLQSGKPLIDLAGGRSGQRSQGDRRSEGHRPEVALARRWGEVAARASAVARGSARAKVDNLSDPV